MAKKTIIKNDPRNQPIDKKLPFKKTVDQGFTLIELLVVIAIIGLLSAIVMAALNSARDKAKNSSKNQLVVQYMNAAELYRDKYGGYPNPGDDTTIVCLGPSGSVCYGAFDIQYNQTVSDQFKEFIPGPPENNTSIMLSNGDNFKGIIYQCMQYTNNCDKYSFKWVILGNSDNCGKGIYTGWNFGGNKECVIQN
ncbi:MAG: type II secretion system protein [Melioribacteraceae bacterium]